MANDINIAISYIPDQTDYSEWAQSFIEAFRSSALSFFTDKPSIIVSSDDSNPANVNACVVLAPASTSLSEEWKKQIAWIKSLLVNNKDLPLFFVFQGSSVSSEIKPLLKGQNTYRFFDTDLESQQPRRYSLNGTVVESSLFWSLLIDIHYDIFEAVQAPGKSTATSKTTVFIAPVTPELVVMRNRLVRELRQRKIKVYPDYLKDSLQSGPDAGFESQINECDLLVHLVGYQYGEPVPGMDCSFTEYYCIQTADYCISNPDVIKQKGLDVLRLICLPMQPDKADDRQQQFIHSMRYDEATAFTEIVQLPVEDLKLLILKRLTQKKRYSPSALDEKVIYFIYDPQNMAQVQKVSSVLKESAYQVKSINYLDNKSSLTDQHRHNLSSAEIVVILDNNSPDQWIMSKIKDIVKAPGIGRPKPFNSKAIITANPARLAEVAKHNGFALLPIDDTLSAQFKKWLETSQSI